MEPAEEIPALNIEVSEIGVVKEEMLLRWNEAQKIWDDRFQKDALRVLEEKAEWEEAAKKLLKDAYARGFRHSEECVNAMLAELDASNRSAEDCIDDSAKITEPPLGRKQVDRRWGPLDLLDEHPPPTAIAARLDTVRNLTLFHAFVFIQIV
jgi:hypothetical protein